MSKKFNKCDIYLGLWCTYILQDVLYPVGVINQLLQLIMLFWGLIVLFKYIIHSSISSSILKSTLALILMYTLYGGAHIMFNNPNEYYYLQSSLNSLLPIYLFYEFTKQGKLTSDRIEIYLLIFIIVAILLYHKNDRLQLLLTNSDEITNNVGYMFITFIPMLFFLSKKPIIQYINLGLILLFVFMSMKRGAILIGVLAAIVLLYANLRNSSKRTKILLIFLTVFIMFGVWKYIDYMMNTSPYFMSRVDATLAGNSSGRDVLYTKLWDTIRFESNPLYFYFGRGAISTVSIVGKAAHQDWLETFCNNGLVGVIILFAFFYSFAKSIWKSKKYLPQMMFYSFSTIFLISFTKTIFSMSIQNLDLSQTMLLGYYAYRVTQPIYEFTDSNCQTEHRI